MGRQLNLYARRPHFIDHADQPPACRGHDPDLWFRKSDKGKAKAICGLCPHEQACRAWAYAQPHHQLFGVWGGTTESDRRKARKTT
ncbi:WhiB family transcriptional regulator [Micromonospora sp. WP24]|uniref:WhiB family transcriptional regulator n=1 Tax=Micromonospora sp. WP24 TaxID=2604469 RepID=UPI0011D8E35B|nr:WhiB family transcriptional regulator [Micromonospora sp. WP24]TYB97131.1 WhiB family transcriptional regulator [Micromonospora sp. WP24]